jgi:hypothetical protein
VGDPRNELAADAVGLLEQGDLLADALGQSIEGGLESVQLVAGEAPVAGTLAESGGVARLFELGHRGAQAP